MYARELSDVEGTSRKGLQENPRRTCINFKEGSAREPKKDLHVSYDSCVQSEKLFKLSHLYASREKDGIYS